MRVGVGLLLLGSMCVACAADPAPAPFRTEVGEAADGESGGKPSGTAPAPSSTAVVAAPVTPAPPPATPVAASDTKWAGALAKTDAVTFGGSPYCTYRTHFEDLSVELATDADGIIKGATIRGNAIEEALDNCPYSVIAPNMHTYSFTPSSPISGDFSTEGETTNQPRALLNATVKADDIASTGSISLAIHRDDLDSPFDWTITATIALAKK